MHIPPSPPPGAAAWRAAGAEPRAALALATPHPVAAPAYAPLRAPCPPPSSALCQQLCCCNQSAQPPCSWVAPPRRKLTPRGCARPPWCRCTMRSASEGKRRRRRTALPPPAAAKRSERAASTMVRHTCPDWPFRLPTRRCRWPRVVGAPSRLRVVVRAHATRRGGFVLARSGRIAPRWRRRRLQRPVLACRP